MRMLTIREAFKRRRAMQTGPDYEETQSFPWWVNTALLLPIPLILIAAAFRTGSKPIPWVLAITLAAVLAFTWLLLMRMRIRVGDDAVRVTFGDLRWIRFIIPFAALTEPAQAVTYRPFIDFGGWGIRFATKGRRAYSTHGDRAVLLVMGKRSIHLGTADPEKLAAEIERRRRP